MNFQISKAHRLDLVGEYYFSKKLEEIRNLRAKGQDIINLGIGSPDLMPSKETITTATNALQEKSSHGYTTVRGRFELRQALAKWYKKAFAVDLDPEQEILPLLGSKEGLLYTALAYLNPGDEALVPNPGYPTYTSATRLAGGIVREYKLLEKNQWHPNFKSLESEDLSHVKIMWLNYPHMPTGAAATKKLFREAASFTKAHGILLCHDNPYSLILNPEPLSILNDRENFKHCIELNSMSKAFNMAGWRVGMIAGSKEILENIIQVKSNADSGMFLPIQLAAETALLNSDTWHQKRNEIYQSRREIVLEIFKELKFHVSDDQVGLFLWGRAPESVSSVEDFFNEVLKKASVFLTPGFIFGSEGLRYGRISLCSEVEVFKEALRRIKKHL